MVPVWSGDVDWAAATSLLPPRPFDGVFGSITSAMAGLYLIGFAAPAFEAAGCHVGEMIDPVRNLPRAFYASAAMAGLFFLALPVVWFGVLGPPPLEGDLARALAPTFAPLLGGLARGAAVWLMVLNMFHGTLQPLAGAARTLSQLAEDGLLPRFVARRSSRDVPWVATAITAGMSIVFLLARRPGLDDRRGEPDLPDRHRAAERRGLAAAAALSDLPRPYRAPRGTIGLGLGAAASGADRRARLPAVRPARPSCSASPWPTPDAAFYAWRRWRTPAGRYHAIRNSLHKKLTGAMLLVMVLDSVGYLVAVGPSTAAGPPRRALEDIFVAVALITISVGLVLPGMISHTASQVAEAADRLANGTLADLTQAMESLAPAT